MKTSLKSSEIIFMYANDTSNIISAENLDEARKRTQKVMAELNVAFGYHHQQLNEEEQVIY